MPARDHHTTIVAYPGGEPTLYVLGGTDSWTDVHADVLRARLREDGSVEPFEVIGSLPRALAGHATVLVGDAVVVVGGLTVTGGRRVTVRSTHVAELLPGGTLGPWRDGPELPAPVMHHTCNALERRIFCVGGRIDGNFTSTMAVVTEMDGSGTLLPFEPMPALPRSLGFHQAFVHDGALYVAGGLHRDPEMADFDRLTTVLRSELRDDEGPSPWEATAELPHNVQVGAATVVGNDVYVVGGMDESDRALDTVLRGAIAPDGTMSFEPLPARLTMPRAHVHQAPFHGNRLYYVGGRTALDRSVGVVDIGTFEAP
jgi:hypothetical protein